MRAWSAPRASPTPLARSQTHRRPKTPTNAPRRARDGRRQSHAAWSAWSGGPASRLKRSLRRRVADGRRSPRSDFLDSPLHPLDSGEASVVAGPGPGVGGTRRRSTRGRPATAGQAKSTLARKPPVLVPDHVLGHLAPGDPNGAGRAGRAASFSLLGSAPPVYGANAAVRRSAPRTGPAGPGSPDLAVVGEARPMAASTSPSSVGWSEQHRRSRPRVAGPCLLTGRPVGTHTRSAAGHRGARWTDPGIRTSARRARDRQHADGRGKHKAPGCRRAEMPSPR